MGICPPFAFWFGQKKKMTKRPSEETKTSKLEIHEEVNQKSFKGSLKKESIHFVRFSPCSTPNDVWLWVIVANYSIFSDVRNPDADTTDIVEEIAIEYIVEMVVLIMKLIHSD